MNIKSKILIAEDDPDDLELLVNELNKSGINYLCKIVDNGEDFGAALKNFIPDIILCDYMFPLFDGSAAFKMRQDISPEVPFVFVTGTLSEVVTENFMKQGITDYVLKDKMFTLTSKIKRCLKESNEKQEKIKIEEELIKIENRFRRLIEKSNDMKTLSTREGEMIYCSPAVNKVLGYSQEEFLHASAFNLIHPDDIPGYSEKRNAILDVPGKSFLSQNRFLHKNGSWIWCEGTVTNMLNETGINAMVSNFRDISDKKILEREREFDNNNLNALINNTADLMWSVDRDFNLITSNQPFDEMGKVNFGKTIAKGENVLSAAYTPDMLSHFKQLYERAFAGEAFTETEYFDFPVEMWTEISYYPIRKEDKVIGTACHSRDITNIKHGEKQLSKSESRLKEAQAITHISNWEIDLVNNVHTWSDEFYKIYGINKGDIQPSAEAFVSLMHPEDIDYAQIKVKEAFETLKDASMNFRFIPKDGTLKYGYTEWRFEFDNNKKPVRLYGIMQDITERKKAEIELKITNERLLFHIENTPLGFIEWDNQFHTKTWSRQAQEIFGWTGEEFKEKEMNGYNQVYIDDQPRLFKIAEQLVKGEIDRNKVQHRNYKKDGTVIWCEWFNSVLKNKEGKVITIMSLVQDVTERKIAEEEREKMITDMIQRNRDLEQFSFIISHNLRAPAANIMGFTENLLEETITATEQKESILGLSMSVSRLDTVIKDINTILQLKREGGEKKELICLTVLINDIFISIGSLIDKNRVRIKTDFAAADEIFSLKGYMHSIFYNLISNSIKYRKADEAPLIEIKSSKESGKIIITYKDNGMGIDLNKQGDKIFGLYKRFHTHVEGKGMGLFMVKTQVESLGGKIGITSEPGHGTEFTIEFKT